MRKARSGECTAGRPWQRLQLLRAGCTLGRERAAGHGHVRRQSHAETAEEDVHLETPFSGIRGDGHSACLSTESKI